eukprot:10284761-Alexandrium_andersonii.AAC.1
MSHGRMGPDEPRTVRRLGTPVRPNELTSEGAWNEALKALVVGAWQGERNRLWLGGTWRTRRP